MIVAANQMSEGASGKKRSGSVKSFLITAGYGETEVLG